MTKALIRIKLLILLGLCALLLIPGTALTQFGQSGPPSGGSSGGSSFGGRSGFSGINFSDPNSVFEMNSRGRGSITINDTRSLRDPLTQYAQSKGITNGVITREQFDDFWRSPLGTAYVQSRSSGGFSGGSSGFGGGSPSFGGSSSGGSPSFSGGSPSSSGSSSSSSGSSSGGGGSWGGRSDRDRDRDSNPDEMAERRFRDGDRNADGVLNYDEMSETLQLEREKFDANRDGFIDLSEYKEYMRARLQQIQTERSGDSGQQGGSYGPPPPVEEEKKPVVFRAGKLPPNMPSWFADADTDKDAQVALFEWKSKSWTLEDFVKVDRNNDGFATVEEVIWYQTIGEKQYAAAAAAASAGDESSGRSSFGGPSGSSGRPSFGGSSSSGSSGRPSFGGFGGSSSSGSSSGSSGRPSFGGFGGSSGSSGSSSSGSSGRPSFGGFSRDRGSSDSGSKR